MLRRRLLNIKTGSEGNDVNTLLLLHLDWGRFLTNSGLGGSSIGNPVKSSGYGPDSSDYKFGGSSFYAESVIYFTEASAKSSIKTTMQSDFTIDYWAKIGIGLPSYSDINLLGDTANQGNAVLTVVHYDEPGYGLYIMTKSTVDGGKKYIINRNVKLGSFAKSGSWNHYAYVRKDNVLNLYVNGNLLYNWAFNPTIPSTQQHVSFGGYYTGSSWNTTYNRFDEIRLSNIARWTENFTPPTQAY